MSNFADFVQRSSKGLFIFIIIVMVIPLVLWGYMDASGSDAGSAEPAGTIFGDTVVTQGRLERLRRRAEADWFARGNQMPPRNEDLDRLAWENAVLLHDAQMHGVAVSDDEYNKQLRDIYFQLTRAQDARNADALFAAAIRERLHVDIKTFEGWLRDRMVINKLVQTVADSTFEDYEKVYEQLARDQAVYRAWVAGIDPRMFEKELRAPTADEVARRYDQAKDQWRTPSKVQLTYLMADIEATKKAMPEPSEAEVRAYYDANRAEFLKPHHHEEGEEHREDEKPEYVPFEEAKAGIPDKIKARNAQQKATELMTEISRELGTMTVAPKDPNDKRVEFDAAAFEKLKAKFSGRGIELVHDVTPVFGRASLEEIEKTVGANSGLAEWAFEKGRRAGEIRTQRSVTPKGVSLFRILSVKESVLPGVTERVRASIEQELRREQLQRRTQQAASDLVQQIQTRGFAAARAAWPGLEWMPTRYFGARGETGLEDRQLSFAVQSQVSRLKPGQAATVPGQGQGKENWSYVIYLADAVPAAAGAAEEFAGTRRQLDAQRRRQFQELYPKQRVEAARIQKAGAAAAPAP